ncbi:MAG: hypothetical protein PHW72_01450 [Candidatus Pacebacteria bacterium]|nr:hypothetical protein [Candidatus Paceibacterota bacterium]
MENNIPNPTIEERQIKEKESVLEILKEMPIIEVACKKAGIGRATYYRWRKEDDIFKRRCEDSLSEGIEFINDMGESQLILMIKEKKMPAIALWLKHNHPKYGSKSRVFKNNPEKEELLPEEEKIFLEALALTSGNIIKTENNGKNNFGIIGEN